MEMTCTEMTDTINVVKSHDIIEEPEVPNIFMSARKFVLKYLYLDWCNGPYDGDAERRLGHRLIKNVN